MLRVTDMLPYFQVKRQKIGDARLRSSVTVSPELGQIMSGLHNSEDILIASFFKMDGRRGRPKTERNWYCQLTKSEEYLDWDEMYHLKAEELSSKITTMDWHCCVTCETEMRCIIWKWKSSGAKSLPWTDIIAWLVKHRVLLNSGYVHF